MNKKIVLFLIIILMFVGGNAFSQTRIAFGLGASFPIPIADGVFSGSGSEEEMPAGIDFDFSLHAMTRAGGFGFDIGFFNILFWNFYFNYMYEFRLDPVVISVYVGGGLDTFWFMLGGGIKTGIQFGFVVSDSITMGIDSGIKYSVVFGEFMENQAKGKLLLVPVRLFISVTF